MNCLPISSVDRGKLERFIKCHGPRNIFPNLSTGDDESILDYVNFEVAKEDDSGKTQWLVLFEDETVLGMARKKYLHWDTEVLGTKAGLIDFIFLAPEVSREQGFSFLQHLVNSLVMEEVIFITLKVSAHQTHLIHSAEKVGFHLMDTQMVLEKNSDSKKERYNLPSGFYVKDFSNEEVEGIERLGCIYELTRFHMDPHIGTEKAAKVWKEIIKSSCLGFSDRVFLMMNENDEPVSIVTIHFKNIGTKRVANFFSVGTLEGYRNRGLGSFLFDRALDYCIQKVDTLLVETQVRNYGALSFYLNKGFTRPVETQLAFHYWNN